MTAAELKWGAGFVAFSPLVCLFLFAVARRPELVILSIIGAFAYLVALLLSSIVWAAIPPLRHEAAVTIVVGVLCQGLLRSVLFRLYHRTEVLIKSVNHPVLHMPLNDVTSSLSAGVGFGLMHCTMLFGSVLASATSDPGVLYLSSCRATPLLLVLAFMALAFTLLDLAFMALTFLYLRRRRTERLWVILALHLTAAALVWLLRVCGVCRHPKETHTKNNISLNTNIPTNIHHYITQTMFNGLDNGCSTSLPLLYGIVMVAVGTVIREHRHLSDSDVTASSI